MFFKALGEVKELKPDKFDIEKASALYSYVSNLLDDKYFSQAARALKDGKREQFYQVCDRAGIPSGYQGSLFDDLSIVIEKYSYW